MTDETARVLVVEDNRDTSALLRDLLEADGYARLQRMDEIVVDVFAADGAAILLVDDARGELRARAALGFGDDVAGLDGPLGEGVAGLALSTRSAVIVGDRAATDPRVKNRTLQSGTFRSVMAAPLIVGGVAIGVLEVARRSRRIDSRAYRLLSIVADRVAVAIEHSRLEVEARELADVVRRIGEGVVVIDTDDRVLFANRAFLSMVGAVGEAFTGQHWTDFLSSAQDTGALVTQMRQQPTYKGEL